MNLRPFHHVSKITASHTKSGPCISSVWLDNSFILFIAPTPGGSNWFVKAQQSVWYARVWGNGRSWCQTLSSVKLRTAATACALFCITPEHAYHTNSVSSSSFIPHILGSLLVIGTIFNSLHLFNDLASTVVCGGELWRFTSLWLKRHLLDPVPNDPCCILSH